MAEFTRGNKGESRDAVTRSVFCDHSEADRLFYEPFKRLSFWNDWRPSVVPPTNIRENDEEYVLELASPGMKKTDFTVNVSHGVLAIRVDKRGETDREDALYTHMEYSCDAFFRAFSLPQTVHADKIWAEYHDGILMVHLPKYTSSVEKPRQEITIE